MLRQAIRASASRTGTAIFLTLAPGDLIFTGTPEGVAAVVAGDTLSARIDGVGTLQVQVVQG